MFVKQIVKVYLNEVKPPVATLLAQIFTLPIFISLSTVALKVSLKINHLYKKTDI